jgi:hypothetical protein
MNREAFYFETAAFRFPDHGQEKREPAKYVVRVK